MSDFDESLGGIGIAADVGRRSSGFFVSVGNCMCNSLRGRASSGRLCITIGLFGQIEGHRVVGHCK